MFTLPGFKAVVVICTGLATLSLSRAFSTEPTPSVMIAAMVKLPACVGVPVNACEPL